MTYAKDTSVAPERTLSEIQSTLKRYGATKFGLMDETDRVAIMFEMQGRRCQMALVLPKLNEFERTATGRSRTASSQRTEHEQAIKSKYRSLLLVIKAKLESVASGIETFDQAFMPHLLLPNGATVEEMILPQIRTAYATGAMPPLTLTSESK